MLPDFRIRDFIIPIIIISIVAIGGWELVKWLLSFVHIY